MGIRLKWATKSSLVTPTLLWYSWPLFLLSQQLDFQDSLFFGSMTSTRLKGSNYLRWSRVGPVIFKARDIILFRFKTFGCITRLSDRDIKQCTYCGYTTHYVEGDNSSSLLWTKFLLAKLSIIHFSIVLSLILLADHLR